jgi:hypothetical protein
MEGLNMSLDTWLRGQSNLVGAWSKSNGTQYLDTSGKDRHLTLANSTELARGILGDPTNLMLKDLNGSDEWATVASAPHFQLSNLSVMTMLRYDVTGSVEYVIGKFLPGTQKAWVLAKHNNETLRLHTSNNGTATATLYSTSTLTAGQIHTVGATYATGGTGKLYIDGAPVGTSGAVKTSLDTTRTADFRIGAQGNGALEVTGDVGPAALFSDVKDDAFMLEWHRQILRKVTRNRLIPGRRRPQSLVGR